MYKTKWELRNIWGKTATTALNRRSQKVSSIIQSNIPRNSVDKDMHFERTGQNESWEISGEKLLPPH